MDKKPKPEWIIYKNDQRIGQAVTWHRALAILTVQEKLNSFTVWNHGNLFLISERIPYTNQGNENRYKIQKERG